MMKRTVLISGLVCALASSAFAAQRDRGTGTVASSEPAAAAVAPLAAPVTCTLTVPPTASNGQPVGFSVNYSPCQPGGRVETFTFLWPSTLPRFTEKTSREKIFFTNDGCISSSFDSTLVPTAGAISGTAEIRVDVRGEGFTCTATATMTVL